MTDQGPNFFGMCCAPLGIMAGVVYLVLLMIEGESFRSPAGRMRRGIPVWFEALPRELVEPLRALPALQERPWGWVRRDGPMVLLRVDPRKLPVGRFVPRRPWPCVTCVDLDRGRAVFRIPITSTVWVVLVVITLFPLGALLLALDLTYRAKSVREALRILAEEARAQP